MADDFAEDLTGDFATFVDETLTTPPPLEVFAGARFDSPDAGRAPWLTFLGDTVASTRFNPLTEVDGFLWDFACDAMVDSSCSSEQVPADPTSPRRRYGRSSREDWSNLRT